MAYNQDFNSQRYPPDQHHDRYQHENLYNSTPNGAGVNDGRQYEVPYGGPGHLPQSQGAYHQVYPNDGFYRGEVQYEPQESRKGYQTRGGHSTGYDANAPGGDYGDSNLGIGQAVMGNYQPSANPSYAPGMVTSVFYSPSLLFH